MHDDKDHLKMYILDSSMALENKFLIEIKLRKKTLSIESELKRFDLEYIG